MKAWWRSLIVLSLGVVFFIVVADWKVLLVTTKSTPGRVAEMDWTDVVGRRHRSIEMGMRAPDAGPYLKEPVMETENRSIACYVEKVEILALDVGTDEWDWIWNSDCSKLCTFTPCCKGRSDGKEEYICNVDDVKRAQASVVHLEWYGVWLKSQKTCGRPCCQRWAQLGLHSQSKQLIGVQNEPSAWGHNNDPQVLSTLTHFATFRPSKTLPLNFSRHRNPFIVQFEFAEPHAVFDPDLLAMKGGAINHPLVAKWVPKSPGPSSRAAVSFVQNTCKDLFYELRRRKVLFDSYGACEHDRDPGFPLLNSGAGKSWDSQMYFKKLALISHHMFDLALENWGSGEDWWNTERVYHALLVHSIPIYYGSRTVFQRIPHPDSIIFVNDFENYDSLAEYILNVSMNESLRSRHLAWTKLPPDAWQNGFPHRHFKLSRLSGAMCRICEEIHARRLHECLNRSVM